MFGSGLIESWPLQSDVPKRVFSRGLNVPFVMSFFVTARDKELDRLTPNHGCV